MNVSSDCSYVQQTSLASFSGARHPLLGPNGGRKARLIQEELNVIKADVIYVIKTNETLR